MSSSSFISSSWSDLPLDLLISIKDKICQRFDLISFRSVCTQWRSAMPASTPFPCYEVNFNDKENIIYFEIDSNKSNHLVTLPMPFQSSPISFFGFSNRWLIFVAHNNETLHLFDPVSNLKLIFPCLSPRLLSHYRKFNTIVDNAYRLKIINVVVSSCARGGVAVAGIIQIANQTKSVQESRLVFCQFDNRPKWSLLMEESRGIIEIAVDGDDRFYAIGEDWELYMLDEWPSMIRLKRFKLLLPEHFLEPDLDDDPTDIAASIMCCYIEVSGESNLKIYGSHWSYMNERCVMLKLDVAKLHGSSNSINVACEAEWTTFDQLPFSCKQRFTPSLKERSLKI